MCAGRLIVCFVNPGGSQWPLRAARADLLRAGGPAAELHAQPRPVGAPALARGLGGTPGQLCAWPQGYTHELCTIGLRLIIFAFMLDLFDRVVLIELIV